MGRNDKVCPHCGRFFSSVLCPRCGYTAHASKFIGGCPVCGYSGPVEEHGARNAPGAPDRVEPLPAWVFIVAGLLVLGALAALLSVL